MSDFKISLIHPSRGRPEKALSTALKWWRSAGCSVDYVLSLDNNDPQVSNYTIGLDWINATINNNTSVVEATNHAAKIATGEILIYLSDDFDCPENWGPLVLEQFNEDRPLLVKVDDCLQLFHVPVLTIPMMNRQLYENLGYFWYPGYKSMFVDEDLYWTAKKHNALKLAPHLKFPHVHPANPHPNMRCPSDETYRRSEANWDQGKALFNQRKAEGFPL